MATGDIPVESHGVSGTKSSEEITLRAGTETLTVRTGGGDLKISVTSGDHTFTISPVDKNNWSLTIEAV
jgi:hypothetical protein